MQFYSKYTGVGLSTRLSEQQKKKMFKQLILDSKALRETSTSQGGRTEINLSLAIDDFERIEDETRILSVSALATDELYIVQKTLCLLVETFYRPLLPSDTDFADVIQLLHEDILKLCQSLLFWRSDLASSVLILVRIDSQLDDKDIRRKCKQLEEFSTADFGLSEHL